MNIATKEKNRRWLTISKKELTHLVWSKPNTQVADELGVHEKSIRDKCKKLNIPKPPKNFWVNVTKGIYKHPNGVPVANTSDSEVNNLKEIAPLFHEWENISPTILEKLIWSEPAEQLGIKFGIGDSAIQKKCLKYCIEKPPVGFWRKVETGKLKHPRGRSIRRRYQMTDVNVIDQLKIAFNVESDCELNQIVGINKINASRVRESKEKLNKDMKLECLFALSQEATARLIELTNEHNLRKQIYILNPTLHDEESIVDLFRYHMEIEKTSKLITKLRITSSRLEQERTAPSQLIRLRILGFIQESFKKEIELIERCLESNDYMIKIINKNIKI